MLTDDQRYDERVLLGTRLVEGLPVSDLRGSGRTAVAGLIADGLLDGTAVLRDSRLVLTRRGRLLADTVVHRLLAS
jgi:oxygen-independent coproporphyrinogen-3 oxidase